MQTMHPTLSPRLTAILIMLVALLLPFAVMAQPEQGNELTVAGTALHFDYQEFNDTGKLLDREEGYIPGVILGLSHTMDRWQFAGDFAFYTGDVAYTGLTNTGIPISTRTRQQIADVALRTEYWLQSKYGPDYAVYLGAGYHFWNRDIQATTTASGVPVSGLFETYEWWSGFIGLKSELYTVEPIRWLLDVRLFQTINPSIKVYFNGQNDNATLALGERWGARVAFPLRYSIKPGTGLIVEPYVERFELGRSSTMPLTSNGAVVGSVFEPFSQTFNYGLSVGISQNF